MCKVLLESDRIITVNVADPRGRKGWSDCCSSPLKVLGERGVWTRLLRCIVSKGPIEWVEHSPVFWIFLWVSGSSRRSPLSFASSEDWCGEEPILGLSRRMPKWAGPGDQAGGPGRQRKDHQRAQGASLLCHQMCSQGKACCHLSRRSGTTAWVWIK